MNFLNATGALSILFGVHRLKSTIWWWKRWRGAKRTIFSRIHTDFVVQLDVLSLLQTGNRVWHAQILFSRSFGIRIKEKHSRIANGTLFVGKKTRHFVVRKQESKIKIEHSFCRVSVFFLVWQQKNVFYIDCDRVILLLCCFIYIAHLVNNRKEIEKNNSHLWIIRWQMRKVGWIAVANKRRYPTHANIRLSTTDNNKPLHSTSFHFSRCANQRKEAK